jgi:hypothetical protein
MNKKKREKLTEAKLESKEKMNSENEKRKRKFFIVQPPSPGFADE